MRIRICPKCGKHNPAQTWHCVKCGQTLSVDTLVELDDALVKLDTEVPDNGDGEQEPSVSYVTSKVAPATGQSLEPSTPSISQPEDTDGYRERGGCLSLWLVAVMGVNLLGIVLLVVGGTFDCITLALSISNFVFAAALWNWKKWGAYGLAASFALMLLLGLAFGDIYAIVSSILPATLLYFLVNPKWHLME